MPLESVGTDILTNNNKHYLCIVDYHSKFPAVKQMERFSADHQIKTCKVLFSEYRQPSKIVSDAGTNFMFKKFENFCS